MHSSLFLLVGLTVSCSAQLADLTAQLGESPSPTVPEIAMTNTAEVGLDATDGKADAADSGSDSPEALISSQTDDNQLCFFNNKIRNPARRLLRAREWCRNDYDSISHKNSPATDTKSPATTIQEGARREGSAASGNLNGPSAERIRIGTPRTSKFPELPPIPGRKHSSQERGPDPCKEERTYAVCSALEPTIFWFPFSLIWKSGSLEYCRLCTFFCPPHSKFSYCELRQRFFQNFISLILKAIANSPNQRADLLTKIQLHIHFRPSSHPLHQAGRREPLLLPRIKRYGEFFSFSFSFAHNSFRAWDISGNLTPLVSLTTKDITSNVAVPGSVSEVGNGLREVELRVYIEGGEVQQGQGGAG